MKSRLECERVLRDWTWWAEKRAGASYMEIAERYGSYYAQVYQRIRKIERRLRHPTFRALFTGEPS